MICTLIIDEFSSVYTGWYWHWVWVGIMHTDIQECHVMSTIIILVLHTQTERRTLPRTLSILALLIHMIGQ